MACRLARWGGTGLLIVAVGTMTAACGSGYHYAKQAHPTLVYRTGPDGASGLAQVEAAGTFFKVPPHWELLDEEAFLQESGVLEGESPEQAHLTRRKQRFQPFDAAPSPSVTHVLDPKSAHPTGFSQVYVLDDDERDGVSLRGLRNLLIRVDPDPDPEAETSDTEVLLQDDDVVQPGGFHGSRVVLNATTKSGTVLTVDKTTLVDKRTRVIYMFVVACEARCFREHQDDIAEVVESWTIRER